MISMRGGFLLILVIVLAQANHIKPRRFSNQWNAIGKHDDSCFTQGISFINSTHILQSCGLWGHSYFHIMEFYFNENQTNLTQTYRSPIIPDRIFLQGSIYFPPNQVIYILTYKEKIVFRFNSTNFDEILPRFEWKNGEGWGMTHNNTHIFVSNGSNLIFVLDENFNVLEELPIVNERNKGIANINELEWVQEEGEQYIYANIWGAKEIVKISISERKVVLRFMEQKMASNARAHPHNHVLDVLNGIAFRKPNTFILTGKNWPTYYITNLDLTVI